MIPSSSFVNPTPLAHADSPKWEGIQQVDVTIEKFCDPAFVDQETAIDTFVAQLCRFPMHYRSCNACVYFEE
ncbi:hypothetical protein TNCV_1621431 [Trichonephila clavipes]|nr:hypothetical protein TNCV_1621431 [Trichonephila clavipes]